MFRKIASVVRGTASLPQILAAAALGGMLGFVPGFFLPGDVGGGFLQAPGLILSLLALVLILDANLAVFGLVTLVAKLLSLALLPVSFAVGQFLLDGPTEGLFRFLVNAPVTAWFGFERYATTGGVAVGLVVGLTAGVVLWKTIHALRLKMAEVEEGSERYQRLSGRKSVRFLSWLLMGSGHGKKTWRELAESDRKGKGVRVLGLVVVAVLGVALWFAQDLLGGAWLHDRAESGLTRWNHATVDVAGATLDLAGGRLEFDGLAMADADRLDRDVFRARSLELDVATGQLLAGRLVVERLASGDAKSGVVRDVAAQRVDPEPDATPPPTADGPGKSLEEYLQDAEVWKARLERVSEWVGRLTGDGEAPADEAPEERAARVAMEREVLGMTAVLATHLIARRPTVTVRELAFDGVEVVGLDSDLIDIRGTNLSSQPALADRPATLSIQSRSGAFALEFGYDPAQPSAAAVSLVCNGLSVDRLLGSLKDSPVRGGSLDLRLAGALDLGREGGTWLELPLYATLRGSTVTVGGTEALLESFEVPLGLSGRLSSPRVSVDTRKLVDALVAAGKQELAAEVRTRADALLAGAVPGAGEALEGLIEGTKSPAELLEEAKQRAAEEAKKRAAEELGKRLPGGLGGLLKKK